MKINQKIYSLLVIISSIITIFMAILYFRHFVSLDTVMLFLGVTQVVGGLSQINSAQQQIGSRRINKASKVVGVFAIILGLIIIFDVIINWF